MNKLILETICSSGIYDCILNSFFPLYILLLKLLICKIDVSGRATLNLCAGIATPPPPHTCNRGKFTQSPELTRIYVTARGSKKGGDFRGKKSLV